MWSKLGCLALAGGVGALARYGLAGLVQRAAGVGWGGQGWSQYPWGTLVVNVMGCFLFGWVWSLAEGRLTISSQARVVIFTGFMGSFTTFSTFAFESAQMLRDGQWGWSAVNLAAHNGMGLVSLWLGAALGRIG